MTALKPGTRDTLGRFAPGIDQNLENNGHWKGDAVSVDAARDRLKRRMPIQGPCVECGAKAHDRHHKDGNTRNNDPSNIAQLCRRCHMRADGRLDQIASMGAWRSRRERKAGGK
jgi:hypothetical protein